MAHFSDSIAYAELKGSSEHDVSVESPKSKRVFLVDWDVAIRFATELTGQNKFMQSGLTFFFTPKSDPERPNLVCKSCRISGMGVIGTSSYGTIDYQKARVEASFEPRPFTNKEENEGNNDAQSITFVTEKWAGNLEVITVPGDRLQWKTGTDIGKPVGEEAAAIIYVPGLTYTLDIQYWFNPPLDDLIAAQGKVNNAAFRVFDATFPTKTLMFMNPTAQRQFTNEGAQAHQVTLSFQYKPEGWMKLYCPVDQEFVEVETADNKSPYKTTNFGNLLPSGFSYA